MNGLDARVSRRFTGNKANEQARAQERATTITQEIETAVQLLAKEGRGK